ncbi:MAG: FtsQ-type POTRA domain-containing protein [Pseudomonadota bacterium]|nr:FtsQ-type POTRA domain-containing protein [Pseudomonadota bacterium]
MFRLTLFKPAPAPARGGRCAPAPDRGLFSLRRILPAAAVLVAGCGLYFLFPWKDAGNSFAASLQARGLVIRDVRVLGRNFTRISDIQDILGTKPGDPILDFDTARARAALEALPWVSQATVSRHLPDTIVIHLIERTPMALWQHEKKLAVVDVEGNVLTREGLERYARLPLIVGKNAPQEAGQLFQALDQVPEIRRRVRSCIRIPDNRWDLRLDNGVTVRLPGGDFTGALRRLAEADREHHVLDRDIVVVDLRLPDRMIVRTSASAARRADNPEKRI